MRVFPRSAAAVTIALALSMIPNVGVSAAVGQWSAPVTISEVSPSAFGPQIVSDGATLTAVWNRFDGSSDRIEVSSSTNNGSTWSSPVALSAAGEHAFSAQLATDGATITAVWIRFDGTSNRAQVSSSADGGSTWSSPVTLSAAGEDAGSPQLVTDGATITAVWESFNGTTGAIQVSSSTDGGSAWSSPIALSDAGQDTDAPQLVTDGATITAVWSRFDGANNTIQVSSSTDGGSAWSSPITLSDAGQDAGGPQIVSDGTTITVVWSRFDGVSAERVQVSSSTDGGSTWSSPVTLSAAGRSAFDPQIVSDGTTITAVWNRFDGTSHRVQAASSTDGGSIWSSPVTLSPAGQYADVPQVDVDGSTITAVWNGMTGGNQRVQVATSTDGGSTWGSPVTVSATGQDGFDQQIVAEGSTTTAIWSAFDGTRYRIQMSSRVDTDVSRLAGSNRYQTAVAISSEFTPGVPVVYLATGTNYPDALSAASAAASQGGPLLLTPPTSLPEDVADELQRLDPQLVVIVGGTGVVSAAVESEVADLLPGATVRRDAGTNRYATSREIAKQAFTPGTTTGAFIATGTNFPDALSASAAAGAAGVPVILVNGTGSGIDSETQGLFTQLGITHVVIAGGTGVVSTTVESALKSILGSANVTRLSGGNRYATSVAINAASFDRVDTVFLATGLGYADALAGAALAGHVGAPLFVVPGTCVPASVLAEIATLGAKNVALLGGPGVLTSGVANLASC